MEHEYEQLAASLRGSLNNIFAELFLEGRINDTESKRISQCIEELVHAERMTVHKMYDTAQEKIGQ